MSDIIIYTDGGCHGNPGPGGWGIVVIQCDDVKSLSGGERLTTNNRMELTAAINALDCVTKNPFHAGKKIEVNIDSQYVKNGITSWITNWKKKGWKTADGKPVKNRELWEILDALCQKLFSDGCKLDWKWVKGHAGIKYNEVCDNLCQKEIAKFE